MKIGFMTCPGTMPGSPNRRDDAFEHDIQVDALRPALAQFGHELIEIDWRAPPQAFADFPVILVGTVWDYQDDEARFLGQLDQLGAGGHQVCNAPDLVRWNARKTYLRDLEQAGAATIPTLWAEQPSARNIEQAMAEFGCDTVVAKRQVGAGAEGQSIHRAASLDPDWRMDHPAMLQPFLPQIQDEGEYSFLFVDGVFSHALRKKPAAGDYRVQSLYGGTEEAFDPGAPDLAAAQAVISAIPFDAPLYARIDMVRGADGALLLMEAEMIEPYLYPEQGPKLAPMLAASIDKKLN